MRQTWDMGRTKPGHVCPATRNPDRRLHVLMGDGEFLGGVLTPLKSLLQL